MAIGLQSNPEPIREMRALDRQEAMERAVEAHIKCIGLDEIKVLDLINRALEEGRADTLLIDVASLIATRRMTHQDSISVQRAVNGVVDAFEKLAEPYAYEEVQGRMKQDTVDLKLAARGMF